MCYYVYFFVVLVVYYRYSFYATCCICHEKCSYLHDLYQYEYDASTDIFLRTYVIFFLKRRWDAVVAIATYLHYPSIL
jgi:hypothetical protein